MFLRKGGTVWATIKATVVIKGFKARQPEQGLPPPL
jgi:hypothetical protein